jgi:hypothetical protein
MDKLGSSPFTWCEFDEAGAPAEGGAAAHIMNLVREADAADLVVLSHGWKNERPDAERLYSELWGNAVAALTRIPPERIVVCGVLWPATRYRTAMDQGVVGVPDGGAAASGQGAGPVRDLTETELEQSLQDYADLLGPSAQEVIASAREAERGISGARARALVGAANRLTVIDGADAELAADARPFARIEESQMMVAGLAAPPSRDVVKGVGGAQGLGREAGQVQAGPRAAVARFLNQLTYFEMKRRAGTVGEGLASSVLGRLDPDGRALRLHLVGHSFGARLVTAAAAALPRDVPVELFSLTLLQGAFSHNALAGSFAPGLKGAFPGVVGRPTGPIAMTHTHNDLACTLAYALASRLSWDKTSAIGDAADVFGAMGTNGAQHLDAGLVEDHPTDEFKPVRGKVNRFLADDYVVRTDAADAHNNVANATVGRLLAAVLEA